MAYYSSPKKYEIATGKTFTTHCPCIHSTGSVKGMVNLKFWDKDSDISSPAKLVCRKSDLRTKQKQIIHGSN